MFKKYGLPAIITLVLGALYYYLALPVINLRASSFWGFVIVLVIIFFASKAIVNKSGLRAFLSKGGNATPKIEFIAGKEKGEKLSKAKRIIMIVGALVLVVIAVLFVSSSKMFNADKYQKMLTVTESNFNEDIAEIPLSQIPVVDKDAAERLGSRKIGEVVDLVSQFNVSSYYTQINLSNTPVHVSPLEYADIIK